MQEIAAPHQQTEAGTPLIDRNTHDGQASSYH
jgi:hypothetical protein